MRPDFLGGAGGLPPAELLAVRMPPALSLRGSEGQGEPCGPV